MRENNGRDNKVKRRNYIKGITAIGIGAGILTNGSSKTSAALDSGSVTDSDAGSNKVTHADGKNVYLVFGAEPSSTDLESWVENNKGDIQASSQQSSSEVIQYQDVSQLNVNQQGNAVAIAINGGDAQAIQRTYQNNENTQAGSAQSINATKEKKRRKFKDVKDVYVVFAEKSSCREFSGWVVSDDAYESEQSAEATIDQEQEVEQFNYSRQNTAVAIAEDESYARAYQRSYQENKNVQAADATAVNIGDGDSQSADSSVEQSQRVNQLNVNEQGVSVAVAVGKGSVAKAWQVSCQFNGNKQVADATAINFDPKSMEEITSSAKIKGDLSKADMTRKQDCTTQSNKQAASANIEQIQSVGQENLSMQNAAVAVALDDSQSTATQANYQANFNAQVASATAVNIEDGSRKVVGVLNGTDVKGDGSWAVSYDNGGNKQIANVDITQTQYVEQLNVNEQHSAIAFAANDGNASAEQVNYQVNENVQVTEATAVNENDGKQSKSEMGEKKAKA
jgi:hypothetical protein